MQMERGGESSFHWPMNGGREKGGEREKKIEIANPSGNLFEEGKVLFSEYYRDRRGVGKGKTTRGILPHLLQGREGGKGRGIKYLVTSFEESPNLMGKGRGTARISRRGRSIRTSFSGEEGRCILSYRHGQKRMPYKMKEERKRIESVQIKKRKGSGKTYLSARFGATMESCPSALAE